MSIKLKIALTILAILLLVAGLVGFFAKRDVETAVFGAEQRSAQNVLHLVDLDVRGRYKSMLMERLAAVRTVKTRLTRLNDVVLSGVDRLREMAKKRGIPEKVARKMALDWIASLSSGKGEYLFVYDAKGVALAYPEEEMIGANLSTFKDVKDRSVTKAMREEAMRQGTASTTYYWKSVGGTGQERNFGLFTYYPAWDWMLGTAVSIEDIEQAEEKKLAKLVGIVAGNLERVHIAESGFVTVFTGKGEVLIQPKDAGVDFADATNIETGNPLAEDLKNAAKSGEPVYSRVAGGSGGLRESFVRYNKALDWYIATTAFVSEMQQPARTLLSRLAGVFAGVLLLGLAAGLAVTVRITRPLERLTDYARTLHEQDFLAEGDEERGPSPVAELGKGRGDEVGRLAGAFEFMEESLRERIRELMEATAARERIEGELSVAHDIQMGLLPKIFPPYPDREEFDLHAFLVPAKEVGGDLYDFFFTDDDHLCIVLGDVSDKGVPAALFMAIAMTLIRNATKPDKGPEEVMAEVNDVLALDNPRSMFVTLFIGVLDVNTGHMDYANGGHNAPVHISADGVKYLKDISGPMVGAMDGLPYGPLSVELAVGDTFFVYTDGVTEAMDKDKALYSDEKLLETVEANRDLSPAELVDAVRVSVAEHVKGEPASDDITMLAIHYTGPKG